MTFTVKDRRETYKPDPEEREFYRADRRRQLKTKIAECQLHRQRVQELDAALEQLAAKKLLAESEHATATAGIQSELREIDAKQTEHLKDKTPLNEALEARRQHLIADLQQLATAYKASIERIVALATPIESQRQTASNAAIEDIGAVQELMRLASHERQLEMYIAKSATAWAGARVKGARQANDRQPDDFTRAELVAASEAHGSAITAQEAAEKAAAEE